MTHFHLIMTQKHKMLSIVVLNMAKYTIISLILTNFVPIFFIYNLFQKNVRGHSASDTDLCVTEGNKIDYRCYEKPVSSNVTVQKLTAMEENSKSL